MINIESKIKEIIVEVTGANESDIKQDSLLYRVGSSNDHLEVIMRCEEVFDIEIADGDAEECETFSGFVAYVKGKI